MAITITLTPSILDAFYNTSTLDQIDYGATTVWKRQYDYIDEDTTTDDYVPFTAGVDTPYITICPFPNYGIVTLTVYYDADNVTQISTDKKTWTTITSDYVRASKYPTYIRAICSSTPSMITMDGGMVSVSGNLAALGDYTNMERTDVDYSSQFSQNTVLFDASGLKFSKATNWAIQIFDGCEALKYAPTEMGFDGSDIHFMRAFNECYSLTTAPKLNAKTLSGSSYKAMFRECRYLVDAPELPATTLDIECYKEMFSYCERLKHAPSLNVTTLTEGCYMSMFAYCIALEEAPVLPATELVVDCYFDMFCACNSLVDAPELPATTLAEGCYTGMFEYCGHLVNAPILPASYIDKYSYDRMFADCYKLQTLTIMATSAESESAYSEILKYVASNGTLKKYSTGIDDSTFRNISKMPDGWTIEHLS